MPSPEASPEPALQTADAPEEAVIDVPASAPETPPGIGDLVRDLAQDTRTLVQQEIDLVKLEVARSARRVAVDSAWIGAGAVVITVGLVCLALAAALGIGALLGSYWLGTLITAVVFLLLGGVFAWRGVRDLSRGDLLPSNPLDSFQEDRDWARQELEDLKKGITEET